MNELMMKNYNDLANAIIVQAAKDYRHALRQLKTMPKDNKGRFTRWEIELFFRSRWFNALTTVDPNYLMKRINEEVGGRCRSRSQESYPLRTTSTH